VKIPRRLPLRTWAAAALAATCAIAQAAETPPPPETPILTPGSSVEGKTIGEWTARWWQWLLTTPLHRDPALDQTGEFCGIDQDGPVWFLAGQFTEQPVARRCKVPEGKHLLFPLYTGLTRPTPSQTQATCKTSQDKSGRFADAVLGLFASLDGKPLAAPERYRERTAECFDPNGTGRTISAQDGYWVMLRPLPPGKHVVRFGHHVEGGKDNTDVTYVLEVGKEASPRVVPDRPDEALPYPRRVERSGTSPASRKRDPAHVPNYDDFPTYRSAVIRARPGFGVREFVQRLTALILRDGKYEVVTHKYQAMGSLVEVRFTWPDLKARYAAGPELKRAMPHPMAVPVTRLENGNYRIDVMGVDPNSGPYFELRAEIVSDAASLVTRALDRREPVTDEELLRVQRLKPRKFEDVAGGDPVEELRERWKKEGEARLDRQADARKPGAADARQLIAGDLSAGGRPLHAVAAYQGRVTGGAPRVDGRIEVDVTSFTAEPIVLLLTAYEPVQWYVRSSFGAKIAKVIALGYHRQTIATAPEGAERVSRSVEDGMAGAYFGYGKDPAEVKRYFERARSLTGAEPASFRGRYAASKVFVDGDGRVRIEGKRTEIAGLAPEPRASRAPGGVWFEAPEYVAAISPDGLTVRSCLAAASQAVKTNRSHVRGKLYFEATLRLPAGTPHPNTNVGLAPGAVTRATFLEPKEITQSEGGVGVLGWGEISRYRDGDVFGIAVDLDASRLYYRVNGEWRSGQPGSEGIALQPGRSYAAAVSVNGASDKRAAECNGWTGNFGNAPFRDAPPEGYVPYAAGRSAK